ncbi:MAG: sodium:calcium antiporter [Parcubacteria group bacterium]|nr:sodium:calcium antiporter [Parcubacteria group bacterium]
MDPILSIALFGVGFFILVKGAQVLVNGSASIAKLLGVSTWFIGAVVVGIGTSLPEFAINLASVFDGESIGLATIIGSHTFNTLFLLGFVSVIAPLTIRHGWIARDVPINLVVVLIASAVILFPLFGSDINGISRYEGFVLLGLLIVWFIFMLKRRASVGEESVYRVFTVLNSIFFILLGFVGVFIGGRWVVSGAVTIAELVNLSPAFIGFTVVAIGTSVPEFAVSIVAAIKRQPGLAIGNILGSNIFGLFGVLGMTAIIRPIVVAPEIRFDIFAALIAALIFTVVAVLMGKKYHISRAEGVLLMVAYVVYFIFLIIRG